MRGYAGNMGVVVVFCGMRGLEVKRRYIDHLSTTHFQITQYFSIEKMKKTPILAKVCLLGDRTPQHSLLPH